IGMGFTKFKSYEEEKETFIPDNNNTLLDLYKSVFDKYYSEDGVKLLEFRIGPKPRKELIKLIDQLNEINELVYQEYRGRRTPVEKIEYGIIIHYIKKDYGKNLEVDFEYLDTEARNQRALDALTKESKKLSKFFDNTVEDN